MVAEQSTQTLGSKVARGAVWSFLGYGGAQILRLASMLVMTRILAPADFGVMAIVQGVTQAIWMFSDIGVAPCVIQNKNGATPTFLNTAWTLQVGRGMALWMVAAAVAIPAAGFYSKKLPADYALRPDEYQDWIPVDYLRLLDNYDLLPWLIPVAAVFAIISGFNSTKLITQNRELAMGRLTLIDLVGQAVGLVVMVGWGLIRPTPWALVAGPLAMGAVRLWMSFSFLPGEANRFQWDKSAAHTLFHFGKWVFLSTSLTFVAMHSDRLIFGKLVDLKELGIYSVAANLAYVPLMLVEIIAHKLLFPVFSMVHNEEGSLLKAYLRCRWVILITIAWGISGLVAGGYTVLRLTVDEQFHMGGWVVQMLAFGGLFLALEVTNQAVLLARGKPQWGAAVNAAKVIGMVLVMPPAYYLWGFPGAVGAFAATNLLRYLVSLLGLHREHLTSLGQDVGILLLTMLASAVGWLGSQFCQQRGWNVVIESGVVFVLVTLVWLFPAWRLIRRVQRLGFHDALFPE